MELIIPCFKPSDTGFVNGFELKNQTVVKKIFIPLLFVGIAAVSFAQDAPRKIPPIRSERKELKREHFANREQKLEMRIRHDKRELRHMRNGAHHDWRHNRPHRPMNRPHPHRRPMMDHKRK